MFLARADAEFRALVADMGGEAAAATHVGLDLDGLIEAAQGRSERLFWTVTDPNGQPGPSTHAAVGGAWFHGAMCAAVSRTWESRVPARLVGTADLMVAVKAFEADCDAAGDSKSALAALGMVRGQLQPGFSAMAPGRAVGAVCSETGMPAETARDMLGVFAVDGAAVASTALGNVAADPAPPPPTITAALSSYRLNRKATELMHFNSYVFGLLDDA